MTTARETIEGTDFKDLMREAPHKKSIYVLETCGFKHLTELRGTELPGTIRLDILCEAIRVSSRSRVVKTNLGYERGQPRRVLACLAAALRPWFWLLPF